MIERQGLLDERDGNGFVKVDGDGFVWMAM